MTKIYADSEEKYLCGVLLYGVEDDGTYYLCKEKNDIDSIISAEEFNQYTGKGLIRVDATGSDYSGGASFTYPSQECASVIIDGVLYAGYVVIDDVQYFTEGEID